VKSLLSDGVVVHDSRVVLVISDDADFARHLVGRWQLERTVPGLAVMSTDLLSGASEGSFALAIVGPIRHGRMASVLKIVDTGERPVICVVEGANQVQVVRAEHPRLLVIQHQGTWLDSALMLAGECLKRVDLTERIRRAEQASLASARGAALGRYMLENRHDLNNSLTSVLGNAELLLLDADAIPELARDQLETIHAMALHMHEIMQRFSSFAVEQMPERQSHDETHKLSHINGVTS
jgi:signal transduction histidine kinase